MALDVVFLGGPADGVRRRYPHLDLALPQLYLFDYRTGGPGPAYTRVDDHPTADGVWRYQLLEPPARSLPACSCPACCAPQSAPTAGRSATPPP